MQMSINPTDRTKILNLFLLAKKKSGMEVQECLCALQHVVRVPVGV